MKLFLLLICKLAMMSCCKSKVNYHPGLDDPGKNQRILSGWHLSCLHQLCWSPEVLSQQRFIILTETLLVSFQICLIHARITHKTGCFFAEDTIQPSHAGGGILTQGTGTWWLSHSQRRDGITYPGHRQMAPWPISWGATRLTILLMSWMMVVSAHHSLWEIAHCKIEITCI